MTDKSTEELEAEIAELQEKITDLDTRIDEQTNIFVQTINSVKKEYKEEYQEQIKKLEDDIADLDEEQTELKEKVAGYGLYNDDVEDGTMTIEDYNPETWNRALPTSIIPSLRQNLRPIRLDHTPELTHNMQRLDKATVVAAVLLDERGEGGRLYLSKDMIAKFVESHFSFSDELRPKILQLVTTRLLTEAGNKYQALDDDFWYMYGDLTDPRDRVWIFAEAARWHGCEPARNIIAKSGDYPVVEKTCDIFKEYESEFNGEEYGQIALKIYDELNKIEDIHEISTEKIIESVLKN